MVVDGRCVSLSLCSEKSMQFDLTDGSSRKVAVRCFLSLVCESVRDVVHRLRCLVFVSESGRIEALMIGVACWDYTLFSCGSLRHSPKLTAN
jgi:hypothetical protein